MENKEIGNEVNRIVDKGLLLKLIKVAEVNTNGRYDASVHLILPEYLGNRELTLEDYLYLSKEKIIWSKEFAFALWGDEFIDHMLNMVMYDEPMDYLAGFIQ